MILFDCQNQPKFRYTPSGLFVGGEQGYFYDISDINSMFQDSAGTVPAAVGQPVGYIRDKSGRGNHATQSTAASRPTLQLDATTNRYYLDFDGTDDFLVTSSITWGTDAITVVAALHKDTDAASGDVLHAGNPSTEPGVFLLSAPLTTSELFFRVGGTSLSTVAVDNAIYAAPISLVVTGFGDISDDSVTLRANGTLAGSSVQNMGTGNILAYPHYLGRRFGTSNPFNGRVYGLTTISRALTTAERASLEIYFAARIGVTLA